MRRRAGHRAVQPAELVDASRRCRCRRDHVGEGLRILQPIAQGGHAAGLLRWIMPASRALEIAGRKLDPASPSALRIIVIYLVLAAQFESFRDPFIIMMSVPLSMFGAMVLPRHARAWRRSTSTRQVGLITLVGLITKHGILDGGVRQRAEGEARRRRREAIEEAAERPPAADPRDHRCHGARRGAAALCQPARALRRASRWAS